MNKSLFFLVIFCLFSFQATGAPLKLGQESVPPNEADAIRRTDEIMQGFLDRRDGKASEGDAKRAIHPKAHGIVRARMIVHQNLPEWAKAGVFQEGAEYKAWIRFSNASSYPQPDSKGDARGFAMKLLGVPGPRNLPQDEGGHTQDFTLNSYPTFFAKDAASYTDFIESFLNGKGLTGVLNYIFPGMNPTRWRLKEAKTILATGFVEASSPLNLNYYSMSPFRHGASPEMAVKYLVRPVGGVTKEKFDSKDENYLRHALVRELGEDEARFLFCVQRQVDAKKMPIEDPRQRWNESLSPFVPVATIIVPRQTFDTPEQNKFGENLTFNPWRGLPDHRPLGGINRLRLCNYALSSKIRHALNKAPEQEPADDWSF